MPWNQPFCFVVLPFGKKGATGRSIDFDPVYQRLVAPAVRDAGLEPVRADDSRSGGILQKQTFEPPSLCDYLVADLTTANAGVYYELGVRHAVRPRATVLICAAKSSQIPFDADKLGALRYRISAQGLPEHEAKYRTLLSDRLNAARGGSTDSRSFNWCRTTPT